MPQEAQEERLRAVVSYRDLLADMTKLEQQRREIVAKYNRLRRQSGYLDDARLLDRYTDEVAPIYWKLSGLWRNAPEGFRAYYRAKRGRSHKPL